MQLRIIPTIFGTSIVSGLVGMLIAANVQQTAKERGADGILSNALAYFNGVLDLVFDPAGAWIFWLGIGGILGGILYGYGRNLEDRTRGRHGGPPFWYLRMQAKLVRFGIRHRWFERCIRDVDASLESLALVLPDVHGMPKLPADTFHDDQDKLLLTREYLRRILPHLSARHIDEGRLSARSFSQQSKRMILERLV